MAEQRYDIEYRGDDVDIVPHFCRSWDDAGGCYGTNPDHGYSWDEAKAEVIRHYEDRVMWWKERQERDHFPPT